MHSNANTALASQSSCSNVCHKPTEDTVLLLVMLSRPAELNNQVTVHNSLTEFPGRPDKDSQRPIACKKMLLQRIRAVCRQHKGMQTEGQLHRYLRLDVRHSAFKQEVTLISTQCLELMADYAC